MKAVVKEWHTEVWPETEDLKSLCKIGEGADCCIFLLVGPDGFECHARNQMPIWSLIERARRGETNAQREGCSTVLDWPIPAEPGEYEIQNDN